MVYGTRDFGFVLISLAHRSAQKGIGHRQTRSVMSSRVDTMGRSKESRGEVGRSSATVPATPETGDFNMDRHADGNGTLALDDLSVSRLRKFFELLDRWDRQELPSNLA